MLCFLLLGSERVDPLALWWGPMSAWMVLALGIILVGAFAILSRLHLLGIAVGFWLVFAAGIGVIAAGGHEMTARWHLGPITGFEFWRVLVFSPEVLVFLFFMITDPKTTPAGPHGSTHLRRRGRASRGVADRTGDDGVLDEGRAPRRAHARLRRAPGRRSPGPAPAGLRHAPRRSALGALAVSGAAAFAGLLLLAGIPARPSEAFARGSTAETGTVPVATVLPSKGVATQINPALARQITSDLVSDLRTEAEALRHRDKSRAATVAAGKRLQGLWQQIDTAGDER